VPWLEPERERAVRVCNGGFVMAIRKVGSSFAGFASSPRPPPPLSLVPPLLASPLSSFLLRPCPTLPPLPPPLPPRRPRPRPLRPPPRRRRRRRPSSRARRPTRPPLPRPRPRSPTAPTRTRTRGSTSLARPRTTASPCAPSSRARRPVSSPALSPPPTALEQCATRLARHPRAPCFDWDRERASERESPSSSPLASSRKNRRARAPSPRRVELQLCARVGHGQLSGHPAGARTLQEGDEN